MHDGIEYKVENERIEVARNGYNGLVINLKGATKEVITLIFREEEAEALKKFFMNEPTIPEKEESNATKE